MSETKSVYHKLCDEYFRFYTIPAIAFSKAFVDFYCKNFFIPIQTTRKTAEELFKEGLGNPKRTWETMKNNSGLAEKIAEWAHSDSDVIPIPSKIIIRKKPNKKGRVILPGQ